MVKKYRLKPLLCYTKPNADVTTTLNYICTLFHGYEASGSPVVDFTPEFFDAVGEFLGGKDIRSLDLKYLEIEE